ncbi:hypothetical protein BJ878DRAFT_466527 [Calycina marina]|uniref:Atos-like conserved domain-containing protein n=1 Tax=Calycina marina TaxID=1763456 RepID=A0A9P8CBX7_9HELO|nr:hypothetical protein BJ878DRAFT_466527 [Calycina marina]
MPGLFQHFDSGRNTTPSKSIQVLLTSPGERDRLKRKLSEESIRTELCEGPIPDDIDESMTPETIETFSFPSHGISDRVELIARLKRGESPTWLPNRNLDSLMREYHPETPTKARPISNHTSPLLPSPEIERSTATIDAEPLQAGRKIGRARSALHSGDFTGGIDRKANTNDNGSSLHSEPAPWLATSPPRGFSTFQLDNKLSSVDRSYGSPSRAPSLSSSLSSSFVLKPPTSPLVQSESNDDLDYMSNVSALDISPGTHRNHRRHTLQSAQSLQSTPSLPNFASRPLPRLRRDSTFPYQAHQPRRSLTSNSLSHPESSPQTPSFLRSRKPSFSSDTSPLHHASMVGSYEESILRGRMSTTPSKPLGFVAQIGVLGLGKCKSNLRCPPHVTVPFPAVFYSYEMTTHGRSVSEDGPSPYVGQIDLESSIPNPDEAREAKLKRIAARAVRDDPEHVGMPGQEVPADSHSRPAEKRKRRSTSPRAPPGGSYRVPEKGQLQIVIKNPNKTAVKLFLVPYDLAGMEPGTKTFIRQRSYSTGPVIDGPISSQTAERPVLRYLVHLHICSPSRGRFYLYKSIRLVFANRVPDGKEKLKNEISLPEPRFSAYKRGRDPNFGLGLTSSAGANLVAEKAFRRRSSGFSLIGGGRTFDDMDGISRRLDNPYSTASPYSHGSQRDILPTQPIPFGLHSSVQSPASSKSSRPPTSPDSESTSDKDSSLYGKLAKGDAGYGGIIFNDTTDEQHVVAESLLTRKLRGVGFGLVLGNAGSQDGEGL